MSFIQVTSGAIPTADLNSLLVVLPYTAKGVPAPNRLPVGFYFSRPNTNTLQAQTVPYIWDSIMTVLSASIIALIKANSALAGAQKIQLDIDSGSNTVYHTLKGKPDIVQFWQGDVFFNAGFAPLHRYDNRITFSSPKAYPNMWVSLIKF